MSIRVLVGIHVRLPLKRVLVVNGDDDLPSFLSYEKLFEVCFYCGRHIIEGSGCDEGDDDVSWFMINRLFKDVPKVVLNGIKDGCLTLADVGTKFTIGGCGKNEVDWGMWLNLERTAYISPGRRTKPRV